MPVSSQHPEYSSRIEEWETCRTFYSGEKAVKAQGPRFLPRPSESSEEEYKNYTLRAFFLGVMYRTVNGLSGAIDRKEPTVNLPASLEYLKDNVDLNHTTLRQFSKEVLDETMITGRVGILADVSANGGDPYLCSYQAESIINWKINDDNKLSMVVLKESYFEPDPNDQFVQKLKTQYRVLKLDESGNYIQELHQNDSADEKKAPEIKETIVPKKAGVALKEIPFVFCNAKGTTANTEKPPLLDLAMKNAEHYRVSADYANSLYFTGNPILWTEGVKRPDGEVSITIGSSRAVQLPEGGKIGLLECQGHGVNPNRERAEDLKKEMAVLGAKLLEGQRRGIEAAETALLRESNDVSTLSNIVVNVSAALKEVLIYAANWKGLESEDVDFKMNDDFFDTTINPQLLTSLTDMVMKELISWDTFIYNLALGEILPPGRTPEEERRMIEEQPPISRNFDGVTQALGFGEDLDKTV